MIINDVSKLPIDWKNRFKHRDCDPEGYSVGIFPELNDKNKLPLTLVLNINTGCLMEYFYDDVVDNSIEIKILYMDLYKTYSIFKNEKGFVLYNSKIGTKRDLFIGEISPYSRTDYPKVKCTVNGRQIGIPIHLIIANTFVPNPYPGEFNIVNHKNSNRFDFSINNLEFCNNAWNSNPNNTKVRNKNNKKLYLKDYLSRHPLVKDVWYKHPTIDGLFANPCGVLKSFRGLTVGSLRSEKLVYCFNSIQVHRLVVECFIGRLLNKNEIIDHIIPVTKEDINNEISNLKICSQKENMNNIETLKKFEKECYSCDFYGEDVIKHKSMSSAINSTSTSKINNCLSINYRIFYLDDKQKLEKLSYIYYKFTSDGVCVDAGTSVSDITGDLTDKVRQKYRRKYVNSGLIAPNGFYYQQGGYPNLLVSKDGISLRDKYPLKFYGTKHNKYLTK